MQITEEPQQCNGSDATHRGSPSGVRQINSNEAQDELEKLRNEASSLSDQFSKCSDATRRRRMGIHQQLGIVVDKANEQSERATDLAKELVAMAGQVERESYSTSTESCIDLSHPLYSLCTNAQSHIIEWERELKHWTDIHRSKTYQDATVLTDETDKLVLQSLLDQIIGEMEQERATFRREHEVAQDQLLERARQMDARESVCTQKEAEQTARHKRQNERTTQLNSMKALVSEEQKALATQSAGFETLKRDAVNAAVMKMHKEKEQLLADNIKLKKELEAVKSSGTSLSPEGSKKLFDALCALFTAVMSIPASEKFQAITNMRATIDRTIALQDNTVEGVCDKQASIMQACAEVISELYRQCGGGPHTNAKTYRENSVQSDTAGITKKKNGSARDKPTSNAMPNPPNRFKSKLVARALVPIAPTDIMLTILSHPCPLNESHLEMLMPHNKINADIIDFVAKHYIKEYQQRPPQYGKPQRNVSYLPPNVWERLFDVAKNRHWQNASDSVAKFNEIYKIYPSLLTIDDVVLFSYDNQLHWDLMIIRNIGNCFRKVPSGLKRSRSLRTLPDGKFSQRLYDTLQDDCVVLIFDPLNKKSCSGSRHQMTFNAVQWMLLFYAQRRHDCSTYKTTDDLHMQWHAVKVPGLDGKNDCGLNGLFNLELYLKETEKCVEIVIPSNIAEHTFFRANDLPHARYEIRQLLLRYMQSRPHGILTDQSIATASGSKKRSSESSEDQLTLSSSSSSGGKRQKQNDIDWSKYSKRDIVDKEDISSLSEDDQTDSVDDDGKDKDYVP